MFSVNVDASIRQRFPAQVTAWFGPLEISDITTKAEAEIDSLRSHCRSAYEGISLDEVPLIRNWRDIFRAMGASPKYRSAIENLLSHYLKTKQLYVINAIVDLYNWISLAHLTPMAVYDFAHIAGALSLRFARKGEPFIPLGSPKQTEKTKNGEVIYADEEKVTCRYWNYRDCHATRITDETRSVVFFADITDVKSTPAEETLEAIAASLSRGMGQTVIPSTAK